MEVFYCFTTSLFTGMVELSMWYGAKERRAGRVKDYDFGEQLRIESETRRRKAAWARHIFETRVTSSRLAIRAREDAEWLCLATSDG